MREHLQRTYTEIGLDQATSRAKVILETGEVDGVVRVEIKPDGRGRYEIWVYVRA